MMKDTQECNGNLGGGGKKEELHTSSLNTDLGGIGATGGNLLVDLMVVLK